MVVLFTCLDGHREDKLLTYWVTIELNWTSNVWTYNVWTSNVWTSNVWTSNVWTSNICLIHDVLIPFHLRKQFTFPHRTLEQWLKLILPEPFVPAYNWYQKWVVPIYCDWSSKRFVNSQTSNQGHGRVWNYFCKWHRPGGSRNITQRGYDYVKLCVIWY